MTMSGGSDRNTSRTVCEPNPATPRTFTHLRKENNSLPWTPLCLMHYLLLSSVEVINRVLTDDHLNNSLLLTSVSIQAHQTSTETKGDVCYHLLLLQGMVFLKCCTSPPLEDSSEWRWAVSSIRAGRYAQVFPSLPPKQLWKVGSIHWLNYYEHPCLWWHLDLLSCIKKQKLSPNHTFFEMFLQPIKLRPSKDTTGNPNHMWSTCIVNFSRFMYFLKKHYPYMQPLQWKMCKNHWSFYNHLQNDALLSGSS